MPFLQDISIGQYIERDSFIHRLDPRTKMGMTILLLALIFVAHNFWGQILITLFLLGAILLARLPIRFVLRNLRPLAIIFVLTFLIHLFWTPGRTLFQIGRIDITQEGLFKGLLITYRIMLLIVSASLLTLTTSPIRLTDGIEKILGPLKRLKVPAHQIAMMMTIALRFIPILLMETEKIMKAQKARGADFESKNPFKKAKSLSCIVIPLFISAFRKADNLALAMEARCYQPEKERTHMRELKLSRQDLIAGVISLALGAGICLISS